jgi:hypothetical protein
MRTRMRTGASRVMYTAPCGTHYLGSSIAAGQSGRRSIPRFGVALIQITCMYPARLSSRLASLSQSYCLEAVTCHPYPPTSPTPPRSQFQVMSHTVADEVYLPTFTS